MKTTICLLGLLLLSACSSKPEEINVSELETPCEHLEAVEQIMDAVIETKDGKEKLELSDDSRKRLQLLENKINEIEKSAKDKNFKRADAEACPNFKAVKDKAAKAGNF